MEWNEETIQRLSTADIRQLKANAIAKGVLDLADLCEVVLKTRPRAPAASSRKPKRPEAGRALVSRTEAFGLRGVKLHNPRWSWGGIRESDGVVVFTIWNDAIEKNGTKCRCLLWAPNTNGTRPWSDKPGGRERLGHCQLAVTQEEAEGVVIYGERRGDDQPLETASKVDGADPHTVLRFKVVQEGDEYWAVWDSAETL